MSFKSFILNGGILGAIRGYDAEREGRPYGFEELGEDITQAGECCGKFVGTSKNLFAEVAKPLPGRSDADRLER